MNTRAEIGALRGLSADLQSDIEAIAEIVDATSRAVAQVHGEEPDLVQMFAIAGLLHHVYKGIEAICRRIIEHFEGPMVESADWHTRLLQRSSTRVDSIRPAILSQHTAVALDPYRGFRHVFRHGYGVRLDWSRLMGLATALPGVWDFAYADLQGFKTFLAACIRELESVPSDKC